MADLKGQLARNVRTLREAKSLSQEQLASLAGLSMTFVSEIERAKKVASIDTVGSLAEALGVSVGDLLRVTMPQRALPNPPRLGSTERIMALLLRQSESQLAVIERVVRAMCRKEARATGSAPGTSKRRKKPLRVYRQGSDKPI